LYYLNARYYDSVTARFITEDTYSGEKNDPLSLNLYTYCHNNPITYDDPSGHVLSVVTKQTDSGGSSKLTLKVIPKPTPTPKVTPKVTPTPKPTQKPIPVAKPKPSGIYLLNQMDPL
jgi:hypothetical protein